MSDFRNMLVTVFVYVMNTILFIDIPTRTYPLFDLKSLLIPKSLPHALLLSKGASPQVNVTLISDIVQITVPHLGVDRGWGRFNSLVRFYCMGITFPCKKQTKE